jgi:alginate O-acetyltransferase complex protein AlgI
MDKKIGKERKKYLILIIAINLSTLFYFKYFNFTIDNVNSLFNTAYSSKILLPIGISFYLFQIMSYVIDVYKRNVKVQKSFLLLSTYISLFPQLIAGPIVRYSTIEDQLLNRNESWDKFYQGLRRFIIGLIKKVVIANNVAIIANLLFVETAPVNVNFTLAWVGAIAYTFQIYFDFSGYSDMAIGLGRMFGFEFLENFNYPYISTSITDFWHRWHISLSTWFRDYVYIPLGGNRKGLKRQIINILIVWLLTGLWHGAAWNFIIWGMYFALILIVEKLFLLKVLKKLPKFVGWIYSMLLIIIGWVIFNSADFYEIVLILKNMFSNFELNSLVYIKNLRILYLWPYMVMAVLLSTPIIKKIGEKLNQTKIGEVIVNIILIIMLYWCILLLVNNSYNPFIYFRF